MSAAASASTVDGDEPSSAFTRMQKFAALLVMLGPETAARILREFTETEIDAIAAEMAKLDVIGVDLQEATLRDFGELAVRASTALGAGPDLVQTTLEQALGESKASSVLNRVAPSHIPLAALHPILKSDPRDVFNVLRNEHPQSAAALLSHLPADKASSILAFFPPEKREIILERLATLGPTPIAAVEKIAMIVTEKLRASPQRGVSRAGGVKTAAAVLNAIGKRMSKEFLASIEQKNPDLCNAIRQKMFTFEDIERLDTTAIQKVLRQVDTRDLALALRRASLSIQAALLGGISKRAAETVKEEMELLANPRPKEIDTAQNRIIEIIRQLESDGEIDLGGGDEEEAPSAAAA